MWQDLRMVQSRATRREQMPSGHEEGSSAGGKDEKLARVLNRILNMLEQQHGM